MEKTELEKATELLADISSLLISSGANTRRALRNVNRIANALNYSCEILYSHSGVVVSTTDNATEKRHTIVQSIPHHGVNFSILSQVSILSWQALEHQLSLEEIRAEIDFIKQTPHYNAYLMWSFVGLAGASLCRIFGGGFTECLIAFAATFIGLWARRQLQKKHYSVFVCWFFASFVSVGIVNLSHTLGVDPINNALATCVLYLIPGVPLINGFMDMLTGYVVSGWSKSIYAAMLIFMISVGFFVSVIIFGYGDAI